MFDSVYGFFVKKVNIFRLNRVEFSNNHLIDWCFNSTLLLNLDTAAVLDEPSDLPE